MQVPEGLSQTLYQRVLGDQYVSLPEALRRFHSDRLGGTAGGLMNIERSAGPLGRWIGDIAGFPPAGDRVRTTLTVHVIGEAEQWVRTFDRTRIVSQQRYKAGSLVESAGPISVWFLADATDTGMQIRSVKCLLFGILLPRLFAPRVTASVTGMSNGWWVSVSIVLPVVGRILEYQGEMTPD